ncbi:uncharacterized protein LOC111106345 isoform X2 [Crassostrea virginica]
MKSSDYDISHRRDVDEIDAELVRALYRGASTKRCWTKRNFVLRCWKKGAREVGLFLCPQMDFPGDRIKRCAQEQGNNHLDVQCEIIEVEIPCNNPSTKNFFARGAHPHLHLGDLKLPYLKKVTAEQRKLQSHVFRPARGHSC